MLLMRRVVDWALRRACVGTDSSARLYYESKGTNDIRRFFVGDAESPVPPEWNAWLRHTRAQPPSPEEVAARARERALLAERVSVLERAENERRLRAEVLGKASGEGVGVSQLGSDR